MNKDVYIYIYIRNIFIRTQRRVDGRVASTLESRLDGRVATALFITSANAVRSGRLACYSFLPVHLSGVVTPWQSCWSTRAAIGLVRLQSSKKPIRDCFSCCRPFLSVCVQDYCKSNQPISVKRVLWLGLRIGRSDQLLVVIRSRITFSLPLFFSFSISEQGILGYLLSFLIQSPTDFHHIRRNEWCRQDNESTTFWQRSSRNPDPNPDLPGNLDSNPGWHSVDIRRLDGRLRSLEYSPV